MGAWSNDATVLTLRPVARNPQRWSGRRADPVLRARARRCRRDRRVWPKRASVPADLLRSGPCETSPTCPFPVGIRRRTASTTTARWSAPSPGRATTGAGSATSTRSAPRTILTPERVAAAAALVKTGKRFSLALPIGPPTPGGYRSEPLHFYGMAAGDGVLGSGRGGARYPVSDDYIVMALQASTQLDGFGHVGGDSHALQRILGRARHRNGRRAATRSAPSRATASWGGACSSTSRRHLGAEHPRTRIPDRSRRARGRRERAGRDRRSRRHRARAHGSCRLEDGTRARLARSRQPQRARNLDPRDSRGCTNTTSR